MNTTILPEIQKFLKSQICTVVGGFFLIFLLVNLSSPITSQIPGVGFGNLASMILQQVLLILLIGYLIKKFGSEFIRNKTTRVTTMIYRILLTFIYFISISLVVQALELPGFGTQENILGMFPDSGLGLYMTILIITIVAPITEELIFRGYLLGALLSKFNEMTAIAISSLIFSLIHFQIDIILPLFILSFLISKLYLKTSSMNTAICFHIFNNTAKVYLLLYLI